MQYCSMPDKIRIPDNHQLNQNITQSSTTEKDKASLKLKSEKLTAFKFLESLREFSKIPASELQTLADTCRFASYKSNQYIRSEGDEESLYGFIVVTGRLALFKNSNSGKELIVDILQSGDIFGMLLMLAAERLPEQLSVRSVQKAKLLLVPLKSFNKLIEAHPILFKEFVAHILISLQSSYNLSRGLAHDRVNVRIATILFSMTLKSTTKNLANEPFTIRLTRNILANLTGTTTETAIRVTRMMHTDGLIDITTPGVIKILKINELLKIVEDL